MLFQQGRKVFRDVSRGQLRRRINSDERLEQRLKELAESFKKAGYPRTMVEEIINKVLNSERNISVNQKTEQEANDKIIVVSTCEADEHIVQAVRQSEENLKRTKSF